MLEVALRSVVVFVVGDIVSAIVIVSALRVSVPLSQRSLDGTIGSIDVAHVMWWLC